MRGQKKVRFEGQFRLSQLV